jgi:hypothetical protein
MEAELGALVRMVPVISTSDSRTLLVGVRLEVDVDAADAVLTSHGFAPLSARIAELSAAQPAPGQGVQGEFAVGPLQVAWRFEHVGARSCVKAAGVSHARCCVPAWVWEAIRASVCVCVSVFAC